MEKLMLASLLVLTSLLTIGLVVGVISENPGDVISPSDTITEEQIVVYNDRVVINVEDAYWADYSDTNSMDPTIDLGTNGIEIVPKSESDLNVGDIVSYEPHDDSSLLVVHRVIGIGSDSLGTYYTMKGDNNSSADHEKVRFGQIKYKTIAIIY